MSDIGIGKLITEERHRDAIHVAVAPVVAGEDLSPGDHIGLVDGITNYVGADVSHKIGIVDPFIVGCVSKGERFYMFLYPGTIESLRHEWTHPAFEAQEVAKGVPQWRRAVDPHVVWIEEFAKGLGLDYDDLLLSAEDYLTNGNHLNMGTLLDGESVPDAFWDHYEHVKNVVVAESDRGSFFSCSC